ncbi:MAG: hypothetical protein M3422_19990, partial [Actinomycetota bacterium]|nr:hypothetical protein [Actinomycetota bacterium]
LAMILAGAALRRVPQRHPIAVAGPARAIPLPVPAAAGRPDSPTRTSRRVGLIAAGTVVLTAIVVAGHRSHRNP